MSSYLIPRKYQPGKWSRVFAYFPVFTTQWRWWRFVETRTVTVELFEFKPSYIYEFRDIVEDDSDNHSYNAM
jgi:hypothetical protein